MIALLSWLAETTIKGSVMIVLVAGLYRLVGSRLDPRWRHLLWLVVLIRLLVPVVPSSSWSLFNLMPQLAPMPRLAPAPTLVIPVTPFPETMQVSPSPWPTVARWLFAIWVTGVFLLALRTLIASVRTYRAVRRALRTQHSALSTQHSFPVRMVECDLVRTPALHGLLRPVIVLPSGMAARFTDAELRYVVLHELWHVRRMDVAVSWLLSVVQTLHWFNPLVWFAASRIKEERELACDELTLSCLEEDERLDYGRTILKLLERFRAPAPVPALVGIVNHKQKMKRRLSMIASFRNRTRFSILLVVTVAAIGAVGLTDAPRKLDPAVRETMERLDQRLSFEVTNASLAEMLEAVASRAGLAVTQAPELATHAVQQARFTLKAENVPARVVLAASLAPFDLGPDPTPSGVTITTQPDDDPREGTMEKKIFRHDGEAEKVEERVIVRKIKRAGPESSADGKLHRELTLKFDENGVVSEGKLTIDIR